MPFSAGKAAMRFRKSSGFMAANKPSVDLFLGTVKKSGLVEPERLQRAVDEFQKSDEDQNDSIALAEFLVALNVLSKWQAEKLLQGKHKGYFLGKYRLLSLLGKGGMSSVFLAEHILMRRRCAIKVLPTKRVADSSYLARFHREAQAVAALDHPNIVRAYDVDHQSDRDAEIHFLVMEYVEGYSLQELVANNGPCQFADAVEYIRQAALGLEHAHKAGMVHRDIKPGNLLVDPTGTVKLLDLGLARYFSGEQEGMALTIAHDEKVLGTADYLAPEQALDSHTVDHRADIYGLGCTLYFLLTGHPPFTEGTLAQRLMAHQTKEPPVVEQDRPDTPPSLGALLRKMMAKKPDNRQNTAAEVADDMWHWLVDHADAGWKQAHPQLFGSVRGSDTKLALETTKSPAPAIPVARPVTLTLMAEDGEADTEIVARGDWPTGDLGTATAPEEKEPELSAFLAQVENGPASRDSSTKTGSAPRPKSGVKKPAPVAPPPEPPAESLPNFDFLDPTAPKSSPRKSQTSAAGARPKPAPVKIPQSDKARTAAPKSAPKTVAATAPIPAAGFSESAAFPDFELVVTEPVAIHSTPDVAGAPEAAAQSSLILKPPRPPLVVFIAAGVVGVALMVAIAGYFLGWYSTGEEPGGAKGRTLKGEKLKAEKKSGPWTVRTIQVYGENADYQSLLAALKDARKYFQPNPPVDGKPDRLTIRIAAGEHDEQVHLDDSKSSTTWPEGIVILGEGDATFSSKLDGPVFSFRGVTGLTIEKLTIDAGKKPVGLVLSGIVAGTKLTKVRIQNFTDAGLVLSGTRAYDESPLVVDHVLSHAGSASAVGIRIEPDDSEDRHDDANNILMTGCRLNGPLAAGIAIKGTFPHKVAVRESIFVKTAVGIRFQDAGRWRDFVIANNSFYQCPIGIAFTVMPDSVTSGLMIRRNLFVGAAPAEAVVQAGFNEAAFNTILASAPSPALEWNWSDRAAPAVPAAGEINLFALNGKRGDVNFAFDTVDPKSEKFLTPSANSPQRTAPSPAAGEQPWVGAVGP